jgi:formylglycine-generating enzyme required for sulfatase activity
VEIIESINNQLVKIPGGTVELRDDRIKKKWNVVLKPFLISRFQLTQDFYSEIVKEAPSGFKGSGKPVETVSWIEAVLFCNALSLAAGLLSYYKFNDDTGEVSIDKDADGYRLPTDAEWEYACRAGTKGPRYGDLDSIAWYKGNSESSTHNVGQKEPNQWGLFDMLGNVWEWCSDLYDESVYGSYRVFRGGGWNDDERGCMATNRRRSHPISFKIDDLGFRIARNA